MLPLVIDDDYLTNSAYGFPTRGHARVLTPKVLAVVHITANDASAAQERHYANRAGSPGPSAHYYIDRDGSGVHAIDERRFAAWSNGDLDKPKLANTGIAYLAALRANGHNANEGCYLEIEGCGTASVAGQWTDAQFETVATLIADASADTGLPISEATVIPHAYINSVNRPHCPSLSPAAHVARLIARAREIAEMTPAPITDETPKIITVPALAKWYDLDGKTVLRTGSTALGPRSSPYGTAVPPRRAMYASLAGLRRLVLVVPSSTADVPAPPEDCTAEIAAAITVDRAKAHIVYE